MGRKARKGFGLKLGIKELIHWHFKTLIHKFNFRDHVTKQENNHYKEKISSLLAKSFKNVNEIRWFFFGAYKP